MDLSTDRLGLNELELFQTLRKNFPEQKCKSKNIIECKDDILFAWNAKDSCLLSLNLRAVNTGKPIFQRLIPSDPPVTDIEALTISETGEDLALWGPGGLNVIHLPRRWGPEGAFQNGKPDVMCRCRRADEHRKAMSPQLEIRRVRWHPGSPKGTHLLELSSDNCLRLYDTAPSEIQLLHLWPVGRSPVGPMTSSRLPLLSSLGDTAVDFDFAPPFLVAEQTIFLEDDDDDDIEPLKSSQSVQWPIMVLRGNGTVYSVTAPLTAKSGVTKPVVRGPLPMYPPADDNYGVDACSVIVLPSCPPLLVVSTCSGTLYHCLIMDPEEREDADSKLSKKSWRCEADPVQSLNVLESVELSLGLPLVNDDSYSYTCPLYLHHHPTARDRYLVSHNAGVHIICLPVISHLERFASASDDKCDLSVPAFGTPAVTSLAEYLVCTRTGSSGQSESPNTSAVLGIAVRDAPATLIVLLGGGEVVSLSLSSHHFPPEVPILMPASHSSKEDQKESFEERIRRMMKQGSTQPVLKLADGAGLPPSEAMDLVARTTQFLRDEYLQRHEKVCEEIDRRIRVLAISKSHQLQELEALKKQRTFISAESDRLTEKFDQASSRKTQLAERAERVLHLACMKQAVPSLAELELAKRLNVDKEKVSELLKKMKELRERQAYQRLKMNEYLSEEKKKDVKFSPKQHDAIRTSIAQMTEEISLLVKKVHASRAELGLSKSAKATVS